MSPPAWSSATTFGTSHYLAPTSMIMLPLSPRAQTRRIRAIPGLVLFTLSFFSLWLSVSKSDAASDAATPDRRATAARRARSAERAEHLAQLGVDRWHAAGIRGRGVK